MQLLIQIVIFFWPLGTAHYLSRVRGWKYLPKLFKKVLAQSEEHDKKILAPYSTPAKKVWAPYVKEIHSPQW